MTMRHLKSNPASWILLALLLGIMVAVLVLPEVDLPDTAFYTNTAPALVHARVMPSRTQLVPVATLLLSLFPLFWDTRRPKLAPVLYAQNNFLPILYRCLLC